MNESSHIKSVLDGLVLGEPLSLLYSFSGEFNTARVDQILNELEELVESLGLSKTVRKRIFNLAVEGLQNIERHGISNPSTSLVSFFLLYRTSNYYGLVFANLVDEKTKKELMDTMSFFEDMSKEEIKQNYLFQLNSGEVSEKGGGGLGLMTIALKSSTPLKSIFTPFEEGLLHLFSTRATVDID